MKKSTFYSCALIAAVTAMVTTAMMPGVQAQDIHGGSILSDSSLSMSAPLLGSSQGGEFIVDQQVVSDDASGSSEYVGDLSASDAGIEYLGEDTDSATAGEPVGRSYGQPDLFYNHFTQGQSNRSNAQMYVSPMPVPPNVGHTFNTYQPFYPEELLYWHKDRYHSHYDNGRGMNRTRAMYYSPPLRQAASNLYWNYLRIPR